MVYDAAGQVLREQRAYGTSLQQDYAAYTYSPNGKRTSVTDANGNVAVMVYDGHDRLRRWCFPTLSGAQMSVATCAGLTSGDFEQYGYDANGNRTSLRKRDGQTIGYAYDALNRVVRKDVPGNANVHYGYDLRGLQTYARFGSATGEGITTLYDGFGRAISSTTNQGGTSRTLSYQNDVNGNRTRITHPDGIYFTYEYDGLDRPNRSTWNGTTQFLATAYNSRGLPQSSNRASSWNRYTYDAISRLATDAQTFASGSANVTTTFTYNPANQVRTRQRTNDAYDFDGHVNVNRGYAVNRLNQYTTAGSARFCYDANGNLTADGTTVYRYDVENRLVEARAQVSTSCPNASAGYTGAVKATLSYDPLGRLFQTAVGSANVTRFLYDGNALVAEYNSSGTLLRRYMHAVGEDVPVIWDEGGRFDCVATRFLHPDHQGSITAIADCNGNPVAINTYDAYGIPRSGSVGTFDTSSAGIGNRGRFQYTGQAWIPELGMYHYKARIYSPTLGRFLQTDPIGYDDQINLYAYVANDPVNMRDPSGNETKYIYDDHIVLSQTITVSPGLAAQMPASDIVSAANSNLSGNMSDGTRVDVRVSVVDAATAPRSGPDKPIALNFNGKLNDYSSKGSDRSHISGINGRSAQIGPTANGSTPKTAAHEIGHGLGARDQYSKSGPTPGKENSIMSDLRGPANAYSVDQMAKGANRVIDCRKGSSAAGC